MSRKRIAKAAAALREELESSRLVVAKVAGHPRPQRQAVERNADWYRRFCETHRKRRRKYPRPRTIIKRYLTVNALAAIEQGATDGVYVGRLLPIVKDKAAHLPRETEAEKRLRVAMKDVEF